MNTSKDFIEQADVKSGRNSDYEYLSFMDYDEKVEYLEDLGIDSIDYEWDAF